MQTRKTLIALSGLLFVSACAGTGNQIVLLGEAAAPGTQAVGEANIRIGNANAAGCNAISVGGYGLTAEDALIGVPVLVECPAGVRLLPDGTRAP